MSCRVGETNRHFSSTGSRENRRKDKLKTFRWLAKEYIELNRADLKATYGYGTHPPPLLDN